MILLSRNFFRFWFCRLGSHYLTLFHFGIKIGLTKLKINLTWLFRWFFRILYIQIEKLLLIRVVPGRYDLNLGSALKMAALVWVSGFSEPLRRILWRVLNIRSLFGKVLPLELACVVIVFVLRIVISGFLVSFGFGLRNDICLIIFSVFNIVSMIFIKISSWLGWFWFKFGVAIWVLHNCWHWGWWVI